MNYCRLKQIALEQMTQEAERAFPHETGGILIGCVGKSGEPVVMAVIGPGPNARHSLSRFLPDHGWQCTQIDMHYESSHGGLVYLGDWHTHPNGSPYMSWIDKRTLMRIAQHSEARQTHPLMLIGAGGSTDWAWQCHQHIGGRFLHLLSRHRSLHLRRFD